MKYILILTIISYYGVASTSVEFDSKDACSIAEEHYTKKPPPTAGGFIDYKAECFKK